MKTAFGILLVALGSIGALCTQKEEEHKSHIEIARMSPAQHVQEYVREFARHGLLDRDYIRVLDDSIMADGRRAVPALVQVINEFDPRSSRTSGRNREDAANAAGILLGSLDTGYFRLRSYEEGKIAIDAVRQLLDRMRAAHFETAGDEGERSKRLRYDITLELLGSLEGINNYDKAIRDTLALRDRIQLSDKELLEFCNYLISEDPNYPTWSDTDWYEDKAKINEAGHPLQYRTIANIARFREAYRKYKSIPR